MDLNLVKNNEILNKGLNIYLYFNGVSGHWVAYGMSAYALRIYVKTNGYDSLRSYSEELNMPCTIVSRKTVNTMRNHLKMIDEKENVMVVFEVKGEKFEYEKYLMWTEKLQKDNELGEHTISVTTLVSDKVPKGVFIPDGMSAFSRNEIQILVSTSVIEVGVNVVNATSVIILNADRFGIAQLHQMRGRVCRSDEQPYFFLISDTTTQSSIDRLKLIEEHNDGFVLAEEDLIVRGPGDFFGEKQTGVVTFKMADILNDKDILEIANAEANEAIESRKLFEDEEFKKILEIVDLNYKNNKEMLE